MFDISRHKYGGNPTISERTENSITVTHDSGTWQSANIEIPNWRELIGKQVTLSGIITKHNPKANTGLYIRYFNGSSGVYNDCIIAISHQLRGLLCYLERRYIVHANTVHMARRLTTSLCCVLSAAL